MSKNIISLGKHNNKKERLHFLVINLASLLDCLVYFMSLSLLTSNFRLEVLFCDLFDYDENFPVK